MEIFRTVLSTLSSDDTRDLLRVLGKLGKRVRALVREHEAVSADDRRKAAGS